MPRVLAAAIVAFLALSALPAIAGTWPAELVAANHALDTATSFRMTNTQGPNVTIVEVQRPDREYVNINGREIIRIGEQSWTREAGKPWTARTSSPGAFASLSELELPANSFVLREDDASDGVSMAHLYHIIYPGGSPHLRWYVRVSDGLVHKIRGPGRGYPMTITIDDYNHLPPIKAP